MGFPDKFYRLPPDLVNQHQTRGLFSQLMMRSVGHMGSQRSKGHYLQRYSECEYILIYCAGGHGWYMCGDERRTVSAGDLLVLSPERLHCYGAGDDAPWDIFWTCFSGESAGELLPSLAAQGDSLQVYAGAHPHIQAEFAELTGLFDRGCILQQLHLANACVQKLLGYTEALAVSSRDTDSGAVMENTLATMMARVDSFISLQELAEQASFSRDYFIRYFQARTGQTPVDYFIRLKMQKACQLLKQTPMNIQEIASVLGYQDAYYFSRLFRKKVGCTPRAFRQSGTM